MRLIGGHARAYATGMYTFAPTEPDNKPLRYAELAEAAAAITTDEPDAVANMANVASLIWHFVPGLNWAGFYRTVDGELVLGPFMGLPACIRIPFGKGVCGAAAETGESQLVPDVHAFPGHIACDANSRSEIVVPIMRDGKAIAVIDLDSPTRDFFDEEDRAGLEKLAAILSNRI